MPIQDFKKVEGEDLKIRDLKNLWKHFALSEYHT